MASHIQIGDISPRVRYVGDGSQVAFPFPFPIFEADDLLVYVDGALVETGYTVADAGESDGGTVTFDTAPGNDVAVALVRAVPIERTTDFQEGGAFRAKVINDELDRIVAGLQQVADELGRTVRLAASDADATLTLPAERAGKALVFDASGNATVSADAYVDQAAAAAASASAAADAQSGAETAQGLAEDAQAHAEEWAQKAEGTPVSVAAGGDGATDFSALHWAAQAEGHATTAEGHADDASLSAAEAASAAASVTTFSYQGTWDAVTNTPPIPPAAPENAGHYYVVGVSGTTSIDGITDWQVSDWLVSNGVEYQKIDNSLPANVLLDNAQRTFSRQINFAAATLTDAATINWDLQTQAVAKVTLGGDRILASPANVVDLGVYNLMVIQDATGGRALAFDTNYRWPDGETPDLSTMAGGGIAILTFIGTSGGLMLGVAVKEFTP